MTPQGSSLLSRLLSRGDHISIRKGRLDLVPVSGNSVPEKWLKENRETLLIDILNSTGCSGVFCEGYSTGHYGEHKAAGVTLQFLDPMTGERLYAVFNADLKRARESKTGEQGSPLPKGQFRVRKGHEFYKFWLKTGLSIPRLSRFGDYMGNLKGLAYSADRGEKDRLIKTSIKPLEVPYEAILEAYKSADSPHKSRTSLAQHPHNSRTRFSHKESQQTQAQQGNAPDSDTCPNDYGITQEGSADKGIITPTTNTDTCEWVAAYDKRDEELNALIH